MSLLKSFILFLGILTIVSGCKGKINSSQKQILHLYFYCLLMLFKRLIYLKRLKISWKESIKFTQIEPVFLQQLDFVE